MSIGTVYILSQDLSRRTSKLFSNVEKLPPLSQVNYLLQCPVEYLNCFEYPPPTPQSQWKEGALI